MPRFAHFAKAVWDIEGEDENVLAEKAIEATAGFFKDLGIPMTLSEVGIDSSKFGEMAEHAIHSGGLDHAWIPLHYSDIVSILKMCL